MPKVILQRADFECLFRVIRDGGYRVVGPTIREEAIVYREIEGVDELPAGWTDEQEGGSYRLKKRNDQALFGYNLGPDSWKRILHPPRVRQFTADRKNGTFEVTADKEEAPKYAFLGVRSCEVSAIAVQDKVFLEGPYVDVHYKRRRDSVLIIAVNCTQAGSTCFCVSMGTGPQTQSGFDLCLTEVVDDDSHYFVVKSGTENGAAVLESLPTAEAAREQIEEAEQRVDKAAATMGRAMETKGIKELLYSNLEHPRWDDVASRCLTCANCTMVCPTCFCTTVEDVTDVSGDRAERWRSWDSCFTMDFSSIHGGNVRKSSKSRYRQWMTHKLATWIDQFDTSGCVGCGRCITWCPVGIDITEEVRAIRENPMSPDQANGEKGDHESEEP